MKTSRQGKGRPSKSFPCLHQCGEAEHYEQALNSEYLITMWSQYSFMDMKLDMWNNIILEVSPGLCKQMPEKHPGDKVARYHQQCRPTVWKRSEQQPVEVDIRTRRWGWIDHTVILCWRKWTPTSLKQALEWNPQRKQKHGRPMGWATDCTWCRGLTLDLRKIGKTRGEVKSIVQDRGKWKATVVDPCAPWNEVD